MSSYRLLPVHDGTWWLALIGLTAGAMLLPAFLLPVIPKPDTGSPVVLGSHGYEWSIPLDKSCRRTGDIISREWMCGDVRIKSQIATDSTDQDRTLRRAVRADVLGPLPTGDIVREDRARLLLDAPSRTLGLSLEGEGDSDTQTMVVILSGPGREMALYADTVWQKFTGGPLPETAGQSIRELSTREQLPLDPAREMMPV
ncbi:hypothetical protein [Corynebacterium sp.]|uniref:hypothetical protein n=1 Tax=Corynebacterium sp. TaxID=1720 RepID=UPI0019A79ACA|nr:hypothetical protein [Corynebacterium sp.]HHU67960.1 hypothetical protein [Corynebacterium sp.]HKM24035.1 hypothetical protein [Corynebacterium sp.]